MKAWLRENSDLSPAARRIVQQLRRGILTGTLSDGMCLPSVRQLASTAGVSVFPVQQALKQAEREKWVERRGGNGGLWVTPDAAERARQQVALQPPPAVLFVSPLDRQPPEDHVFTAYADGVTDYFERCAIRRVNVDVRSGLDPVRQLIHENAQLGYEVGYVLFWMPPEAKRVFAESEAACVVVGNTDPSIHLPCVYEDMHQLGHLAGRILCSAGRMKVLHAQELVGAEVSIVDGARRAARENGFPDPRWEEFYHRVPEERSAAEACVHQLLTGPDRPAGILALRPELALIVVKVATRLRIDIPDELEVIGYCDSPVFNMVHPEITSIGPQSVRALGRRCGELLAESLSRRPERIARDLVDSVLFERQSTRPRHGNGRRMRSTARETEAS